MTDGESCRHAQSGSSCGGGYEKAHLWSAFINPDLFLWKRALHQPQPSCPHGDRDPHPEELEPGVWERMGLGVKSGAPSSSHFHRLSSLPSLLLPQILLLFSLVLSILSFPPWPATTWAKVPLQTQPILDPVHSKLLQKTGSGFQSWCGRQTMAHGPNLAGLLFL